MKKLFVLAFAMIVMTGTGFSQYKTKKLIIPIANRASTFGTQVKIGDFIYIEADSALYMAKVNMGPNATGTYMMASTSRYAVAKFGVGVSALTATTGTFSSTLGVTGNVGIGTTDQNKFTITGASGNTAIAGTLAVTGTSALAGVTATKVRALDSLLVGPTKFYRGTTATAVWADDTIHSILGFKTGASGGGDFGVLTVSGVSTLAGATATKVRALDSLLVGPSKLYRGTSATALWCDDTLHSLTGFKTGSAGAVSAGYVQVLSTDTITAAPVGSLCFKISDSTLYLKIRATGTTGARWKALND